MARAQSLDPRLPDWRLKNWSERLTQRLSELFRTIADELNQRLAFGTRTIYVPASAMVARTTNGPASGSAELGNKVMLSTLDFDPATAEYAQFSVQMPQSWNRGIVRAKFLFTHATATASTSASCGVVWRLQAQAFSNGDSLNTTFSTVADVSKIGVSALTLYASGLTASYTVEHSPAVSDWVCFQVSRQPGETADTFADADAKLIGVSLLYEQTAMTDVQ